MSLRIVLAALHLIALGIGLGAIYSRARALNRLRDGAATVGAVFAADNWWGIAAVLWIVTGLWRAMGGFEKAPSYYWSNHVFYAKMGFLVVILLLEIWPMSTLIRWRIAARRGPLVLSPAQVTSARRLARVSDVQTLLILCMVVAAVMMARGYGVRG
jgi:putative membrane protein